MKKIGRGGEAKRVMSVYLTHTHTHTHTDAHSYLASKCEEEVWHVCDSTVIDSQSQISSCTERW